MKRDKNSFVTEHFPNFLAQHSLKPLPVISFSEMVQPPRFPTFQELVIQDQKTTPSQTKKKGLFEELLRDSRVLMQDLQSDPTPYLEGTREAVEKHLHGLELTDEERRLLDAAVLTYAEGKRPEPEAVAAKDEADADEPELEWRDSGKHVVVGDNMPAPSELPSFWWERT